MKRREDDQRIGADRPRPGHLHVSSLASSGYAGRSLIFVVGLEEGRVFPAAFEDPVLLDSERAAISPSLTRSTDRTDEAVYAALGRLAAMSGNAAAAICLSYSCRDLREYRETYASWLLLQAYRAVSGNPAAKYGELHEHLGMPKSCVPDDTAAVLSESRWWLRGAARAGEVARTPMLARYPALQSGLAATQARGSDRFTEFDGHVPAAGPVLDPCAEGVVVSPTQLEDAAKCPFRHFLKRGLGIDAIESGERDRDVWIDPLLRGSLLHELYADLLRTCRSEGRRVKLPDDGEWLKERGREALARLAVEMPPPSAEVRERETTLFLDDLAMFVEAEAALDPAQTPVGFEISFGRSKSTEEDPLARSEPVLVDLGNGLKLRLAGRIDRIDRLKGKSFEIIDYKTGSYFADAWKGTFAGGGLLQHALYGLAARELLKRFTARPDVSGAEYYFTSAKGQQERKKIPSPSRAQIAEVLSDLRRVIVSGLFVHADDGDACKFCRFGYACGAHVADRTTEKMADRALEPYTKLAAHE